MLRSNVFSSTCEIQIGSLDVRLPAPAPPCPDLLAPPGRLGADQPDRRLCLARVRRGNAKVRLGFSLAA
jgi:hypothetical protein